MKYVLSILISLMLLTFGVHAQTPLWTDTLVFTPTSFLVDDNGNTTISRGGSNDSISITRKYDTEGNMLWQIPFGGKVIMDTHGDLIIDGYPPFSWFNHIQKYSSSGDSLWSINQMSSQIINDSADNVYIYYEATSLLKVSPNGKILFNVYLPEEFYGSLFGPHPFQVDANGRCTASIIVGDSIGFCHFNSDGTAAWKRMYPEQYNKTEIKNKWTIETSMNSGYEFKVDLYGNVYIYGTEYLRRDVYPTAQPYDFYSRSADAIAWIDFVKPSGKVKKMSIKGPGKTRYTIKQNGHSYTGSGVGNLMLDLVATPSGLVYYTCLLDYSKHIKGGAPSTFINEYYLSVHLFRRNSSSIKWKNNYMLFNNNSLNNRFLLDKSERPYLPLMILEQVPVGQYKYNYYRFDSTGSFSKSSNLSYQTWGFGFGVTDDNENYKFDLAGNMYAVCQDSNNYYLSSRYLKKYPPLTFSSPSIQSSSIPYNQGEPLEFRLHQNYPNPFNPSTTISFELANEALVTVKVFNTLGQEIATLAEKEEFGEGPNELQFDASALPSGVYFYRIITEGVDGKGILFTNVKKMMLVK